MPAGVLIVGYGNPLRGDDGWDGTPPKRCGQPCRIAEIITVHQLTPELAEEASRAELVVFLDARRRAVPGEWGVASWRRAFQVPSPLPIT